ncbi:MAG: allantoinase AllB [Chthoniobacterales bacterium]
MKDEFVIHGGTLVTDEAVVVADVRIVDGRIAEIGPGLGGTKSGEIDAAGCWVLAGVVDGHVHFNEPGRTEWEGFATGSRALAAGGGTTFVDMPLNASPPTVDRAAFELKKAAGEASSGLDFGLWGGLVPGNEGELAGLADCGVVGFKAFMIDSGITDFPGVDTVTLRAGMKRAAELGLPVAVHAEDAEIVGQRTAAIRAEGRTDARAFLDSRPVESEVEAVRVALDVAGETGCSLHVVHVSCEEAAAAILDAKGGGADVTFEVCAHHLLLDESVMIERGAVAKCAPPLRPVATIRAMQKLLEAGRVDLVGSDHSPAPPELKSGDDLFAAWGGIMGCQHGFLLLLEWALATNPRELPRIWRALTVDASRRLGLPKRGLEIGADADVIVVAMGDRRAIERGDLRYRHATSPYVGRELGLRLRESFLRGQSLTGGETKGRFLPRVGRLTRP